MFTEASAYATECLNKMMPSVIPHKNQKSVSLFQSYIYIYIYTAFMQTNPNNHLSGIDSSIIQPRHHNICVASARINERLFPKGSFYSVTGIIHHGCNKDNNLPVS